MMLKIWTILSLLSFSLMISAQESIQQFKRNVTKGSGSINSPAQIRDGQINKTTSKRSDNIVIDASQIEGGLIRNMILEEIRTAYAHVVDEFEVKGRARDYWGLYYFLSDITGDGIPELWIQANNEDDPNNLNGSLIVYSYDDLGSLVTLFKGDSGHPYHHSFYQGKNYVILNFAHMDSQAWIKYEYNNGHISERRVFSTNYTLEYKVPMEQEIETYEMTDKSPIEQMNRY